MILESALAGGITYFAGRRLLADWMVERKIKADSKEKWNFLMLSIGKTTRNDMLQGYELLDVFVKHYGFDAIVSIPAGKKFLDLISILPTIEASFGANVIINTVDDKNSAYMRVHYVDREISVKDNLRFNWFKTFYNIEGCITKNGETIKIDEIEEVKDPAGNVVGYEIESKIPIGLSYDKIKNCYDTITKTMGKCFLSFDYEKMVLRTTIVHKPINNNVKFYPIKVKPWELYVAMGQDYAPVLLDYSKNANTLIGGTQGTGKTNAIFSSFINLCNQCNGDTYEDGFDLYVSNMGEKNDLRIFRDVKQCKYYANNQVEVLAMLKHLKKEVGRRNRLFAKEKSFCFNIHQYNKLIKDKTKQLKVIHLIADEIADLMSEYKDDGKEEIQRLLEDIIRKSRSSGIYITMATQRGSLKNMSSEVKGQLANQVCFSQPNVASALTIVNGEDTAKRVMSLEKTRECLVNYIEGVKVAKTLYLDERMMEDLLEDVIVDDSKKLILDNEGNIVTPKDIEKTQEVPENTEKNSKKSKDSERKGKKPPRFDKFIKEKEKGAKKK